MAAPERTRWIWWASIFVLLCLVAVAVWYLLVPGPPEHLVLIVVDTLRADVLGCYGGDAVTPNIDRLASEGVRFDQARSHIPSTGPSHLSLFTSLTPNQHGLRNNGEVVPDDVEMLAERLKRAEFSTVGVVSLGVLKSRFGFSRGFDRFEGHFRDRFWHDAAEINRIALPLIEKAPEGRRFVWVHYSDPHAPYGPPGGDLPTVTVVLGGNPVAEVVLDGRRFSIPVTLAPGENHLEIRPSPGGEPQRVALRKLRVPDSGCVIEPLKQLRRGDNKSAGNLFFGRTPLSMSVVNPGTDAVIGSIEGSIEHRAEGDDLHLLYRQEVEFADRQIGRLIETLHTNGMWDDSLIVFLSDHGEELSDHGLIGHRQHLYEETLRVPLIMVSPGALEAGTAIREPVRLIDVLPTVLEILGLDPTQGIEGETLLSLVDGSDGERTSLAMTYPPHADGDRRALVSGRFKLIWDISDDRRELYDLENDPLERDDLVNRRPEIVATMYEQLRRMLSVGRAADFAQPAELSEEEVDGLRALGYVD